MRKFLLGSVFCLLLTACDDKSSTPTTTVSTSSKSVETELRGALTRSGLNAKNVAFREAGEVLTFTVGTCEGGATMFSMKIFQGQAEIFSVPLTGDDKGALDTAQRKTVAEKCGN